VNTHHTDLQIAEEAADWLLRLEMDEGPECRNAFIAWLKHSPRHVDEFLVMTAVVRAAKQDGRKCHIDVEALIREVSTNVVPLPRAEGSGSTARPSLRERIGTPRSAAVRWATAAMLVLTLGLGALAWQWASGNYVTPIGEQRSIKLQDGSFVYLNTRSRIKVSFSRALRDIQLLEGEALFVVAQDAGRPFRVLTDSAVVQAIGTQFNVYTRKGATAVAVVEGRVKIASKSQASTVLSKGEQVEVARNGRMLRQTAVSPEDATAWRQRRLVFHSDTLEDIAREFNRYNRLQIRIESQAASERRFTAVFNADEPQALLTFLRDDRALEIRSSADEVVIRSR
jgi:transmembrane sensor